LGESRAIRAELEQELMKANVERAERQQRDEEEAKRRAEIEEHAARERSELRWYREKVERMWKQQELTCAALCDRIMAIEEQCAAALAQAEATEEELFNVDGELFIANARAIKMVAMLEARLVKAKRAELAAVRASKAAEAAQAAMLQSRMWDPGKRVEKRITKDQPSKRQDAAKASSIS
jgi:hypothetical protein